MEELVAKIFGQLSIRKQEIQNDVNLTPEQKVNLTHAIDEKMNEPLEARIIGYEALRVLYFNKNSDKVKEIDLHESIGIKIAHDIATAIKNNATNEEIKNAIKCNLNTPEEHARFFIEKDLRNEYDYSTISYETVNEIFPTQTDIYDQAFKAFDWIDKVEQVLYGEVLINADVFVEAMKTMQSMVVNYLKEESYDINL